MGWPLSRMKPRALDVEVPWLPLWDHNLAGHSWAVLRQVTGDECQPSPPCLASPPLSAMPGAADRLSIAGAPTGVLEPGSSRVNNRLTPARCPRAPHGSTARRGWTAGPPLQHRPILLPHGLILPLQPHCPARRCAGAALLRLGRLEAAVMARKGSLLLGDPLATAPLLIFLCRLRGEAEALERSRAVQ